MFEYQVIARKYRPQTFMEVLGQEAVVTTLKNAIKFKRLAHAYLFCGSRGTGKTTLARVFAKALNCQAPTQECEPCNACPSCKEIASSNSLDVLEIDGASHRGIDDIRQINETVGYAASCGKYKVYIIDEVHMLTKEAFNALLKTLEEPPPKVVFLFATTEAHKLPATILSRCQRFNLNRISIEKIIDKLKRIAGELNIDVEEEALRLLAQRAEGGLRDAESLFDQIIAFHEGNITAETVADVLGIVSKDILFILDEAGKKGNLSVAFDIAHQIFSQGKDLVHFIESLTEHFRNLLLVKLAEANSSLLSFSASDKGRYQASAKLYTQEQCLTILDFLIEAQSQIRFQSNERIALEAILLRIMRTHQRLPIEYLVRRLAELEQSMAGTSLPSPSLPLPSPLSSQTQEIKDVPEKFSEPKAMTALPQAQTLAQLKYDLPQDSSLSEDPTPSLADLGRRLPQKTPAKHVSTSSNPPLRDLPAPASLSADTPAMMPSQIEKKPQTTTTTPSIIIHKQSHYDTLLQFAAVELEGTVQKKQQNAFN